MNISFENNPEKYVFQFFSNRPTDWKSFILEKIFDSIRFLIIFFILDLPTALKRPEKIMVQITTLLHFFYFIGQHFIWNTRSRWSDDLHGLSVWTWLGLPNKSSFNTCHRGRSQISSTRTSHLFITKICIEEIVIVKSNDSIHSIPHGTKVLTSSLLST